MYSVVIIGGGILGLSTALKIKEKNPNYKVAVVEKEVDLASHQSSHNSGVIHSGLYYKPGSLKARNCVQGYHQLLAFCDEEEIPYQKCGKIVVATKKNQFDALDNLYERGIANGLKGIKKIDQDEIKAYEPHVVAEKGLYVPQTAIINYKLVAEKYAEKFKHFGGEIYPRSRVIKFSESKGFIHIHTKNERLTTRIVINCAGLYSDKIAKLSGAKIGYRIIPFRGEYYKLNPEKEYLVKNLIYPVPDPSFPFLGVHFTRLIDGGIEAGPNAVLAYSREGYNKWKLNTKEFLDTISYLGFLKMACKHWKNGWKEFYRSNSKQAFTKALQELIPEVESKDLVKGGAGVRAQACSKDGHLIDDFLFVEHKKFIHLGNAPSPAATSSLAIGETIAEMTVKRLSK